MNSEDSGAWGGGYQEVQSAAGVAARAGLRSCSWAILRVLVGLWRGTAFHPATRVAVPEAFLARRICVVHQLARAEEPAQRPGSPLGASWVGSSIWVFGFSMELGRLRLQRSSAALWRSTPGAA